MNVAGSKYHVFLSNRDLPVFSQGHSQIVHFPLGTSGPKIEYTQFFTPWQFGRNKYKPLPIHSTYKQFWFNYEDSLNPMEKLDSFESNEPQRFGL